MKRGVLVLVVCLLFMAGDCFIDGRSAGGQSEQPKKEQRKQSSKHKLAKKSQNREDKVQQKAENAEFRKTLKRQGK